MVLITKPVFLNVRFTFHWFPSFLVSFMLLLFLSKSSQVWKEWFVGLLFPSFLTTFVRTLLTQVLQNLQLVEKWLTVEHSLKFQLVTTMFSWVVLLWFMSTSQLVSTVP